MPWQKVAEGTNLWDLEQIVTDLELPKGTQMKVAMKTSVPDWVFDLAGAELAFRGFVPGGMTLVDVYGKGGQGIVEMEADPAWLAASLVFIKAHWVAIAIASVIGTFVLTAILTSIIVSIRLPAEEILGLPIGILAGVAAGIAGILVVGVLVSKGAR